MLVSLRLEIALLATGMFLTACTGGEGPKSGTVVVQNTPSNTPPVVVIQGVMKPGAGRGVLCRAGGRVTVQTLDLYAAKSVSKRDLVDETDDRGRELDQMAYLIASYFKMPNSDAVGKVRKDIRKMSEKILAEMKLQASGEKLALLPHESSKNVVLADGCEHVQIAAYDKAGPDAALQVDSFLWTNMTWTQRTSFLAREIVDRLMADYHGAGDDAVGMRRLIGAMYMKNGFRADGVRVKAFGLPRASLYQTCYLSRPDDTRKSPRAGTFFVYENGLQTVLLFDNFKGLNTLFHTIASVPMLPADTFPVLGVERSNVESVADIYVEDQLTNYELQISWHETGPGLFTLVDKSSGARIGDYRFSCRGLRP